jgi:membrane protein YdbS with pleckstrin-like domain
MSQRSRAREQQRAAELEAVLGPATPAQQRPEAVVLRLRRHGRLLTLPTIVLLGTAFASGFFIGSFDDAWQNWVALAVALILIIGATLLPLSIWLGNTITVTTRRVIVRRGVLTRTRTEVALTKVQEIRSRASVLQRMFRAGTVHLITGPDQTVSLVDVPAVNEVLDVLHELVSRADAAPAGVALGEGATGTQPFTDLGAAPGETRVLTEVHDDVKRGF